MNALMSNSKCRWKALPCLLLPKVVSSGLVRMAHFVPVHGLHEDARFPCLFRQSIVDVRDDGEGGSARVADADVDPVTPGCMK